MMEDLQHELEQKQGQPLLDFYEVPAENDEEIRLRSCLLIDHIDEFIQNQR